MTASMSTHDTPHCTTPCGPAWSARAPDAEPPIDLDTMLDLTAQREVDGVKFDGVDLFLFDPHVEHRRDRRRAEAARRQDRRRKASSSARWSRRSGRRPAAASAMGDEDRAQAVRRRRCARRARSARRCATSASAGTASSASTRRRARPTGRRIPEGNTKKIAETFREAADVAEGHGERLAAEGEICWGGMHSWKRMVELLELVGRPKTLGFQADMAHTLLYTLGYNAPEDRILPADYDWTDAERARRRAEEADRRAAAVDDRLPRRAERRDGERLRLARQDRPPLPADRSQRQARHRHARRLLAARRQRQADPSRSSTSAGTAACSRTR